MPLLHLPVVHKFGIISHSRRLELQERLLQAALQDGKTKEGFQSKKNPFDVTDEFIKKYNAAQTATEKSACEAEAQRLLARVKRRTGLKDGGVGSHVNLPFAWTELVFLAHCRGRVHQDALDALLISLEQAPVGYYQIPALFYIAETVLYWLQSESPASDALRSAEVKSLKVGQLAFLRLFYHHMSGQLQRHDESRARLAMYLKEFPQLEQLYASYPDVAFCHAFISSVGMVVASKAPADDGVESAKISEGHAGQVPPPREPPRGVLVTAEVHELSPILWHALDVWRCARHLGDDLGGALDGLLTCSVTMAKGNWIDAYLALLIVGNAACEDAEVLRIFLELAVDREMYITDNDQYDSAASPGQRRVTTSEINDLSRQATSLTVTGAAATSEDGGSQSSEASVTTTTFPVLSFHGNRDAGSNVGEEEVVGRTDDRRPVAEPAEPGRHVVGMETWRWELSAGFVQQLARICLDGASSSVRQRALADPRCSLTALATRKIDTDDGSDAETTCWRVRYLALQSLAVVSKVTDTDDLRKCLRDAAWPTVEQVQRRERVPLVLDGLPLANVWAELTRQADVTQPRALSGLAGHLAYALTLLYLPALPPPVRLTHRSLQQQQQQQQQTLPQSHQSGNQKRAVSNKHAPTPAVATGHARGRKRTSLRQELQLAAISDAPTADFATRKGFDLRRVVEDQWRKQAQSQLELENATRDEKLLAAATAASET